MGKLENLSAAVFAEGIAEDVQLVADHLAGDGPLEVDGTTITASYNGDEARLGVERRGSFTDSYTLITAGRSEDDRPYLSAVKTIDLSPLLGAESTPLIKKEFVLGGEANSLSILRLAATAARVRRRVAARVTTTPEQIFS